MIWGIDKIEEDNFFYICNLIDFVNKILFKGCWGKILLKKMGYVFIINVNKSELFGLE